MLLILLIVLSIWALQQYTTMWRQAPSSARSGPHADVACDSASATVSDTGQPPLLNIARRSRRRLETVTSFLVSCIVQHSSAAGSGSKSFIGMPANSFWKTRSFHHSRSFRRNSFIGTPGARCRAQLSCTAVSLWMNGFVIGMKLITCRRTPMTLSSCFLDMNFFCRVSLTVSFTLSIFL